MAETAAERVPYLSDVEIEARAREVRIKHGLDTIPVDPIEIAQREGIDVWNEPFKNSSVVGMVLKSERGVEIFVRKNIPRRRQLFTVAHELGHYFLHLDDHPKYVDHDVNLYRLQVPAGATKTDSDRREIQANKFAAALLMPERQVRQFWKDTRSVREMARIFEVSTEAMGYRLAELGLD